MRIITLTLLLALASAAKADSGGLRSFVFAPGSAELTEEHRGMLRHLAELMARYRYKVILYGHLGLSEPEGAGLSESRLRAIESHLVGLGVDPAHVLTEDVGRRWPIFTEATCPSKGDFARCEQYNVRVEPQFSVSPLDVPRPAP
jgi:outer membrane protein OmpA-like peptidoglycan-associated protein